MASKDLFEMADTTQGGAKMAEYRPTSDAEPRKGEQPPAFGVELIDVLLRGLSTAKERMKSGNELERGRVCIGFYGDPGHWCPIFYSNPRE